MARRIRPCHECGLPLQLSRSNRWHGDGTVTAARDPGHRLLFCESDILDELFLTIREAAGSPIDQIVQDSKCRTARWYMEKRVSPALSRLAYAVTPKRFAQFTADLTRVMGFGSITVNSIAKHGREGDLVRLRLQYPYSLPLVLGDIRAGLEFASGRECAVTCRPVEGSQDLYDVELRTGTAVPGPSGHAAPGQPARSGGDVGFRRCPICLMPTEISVYRWDLGKGMIFHPETGRRVSLVSPYSLEYVVGDLQGRLGEAIPEAVIESTRRFSSGLFHRELQGSLDEAGLRRMLALRGFGSLSSFSLERGELSVTVQNPCLPLILVGLAKGACEAATGSGKTSHDWSLGENGDISIIISPA